MLNRIIFEIELIDEILSRRLYVWLVPVAFLLFALALRYFLLTPTVVVEKTMLVGIINIKHQIVTPAFDLVVLIMTTSLFIRLYLKERKRIY